MVSPAMRMKVMHALGKKPVVLARAYKDDVPIDDQTDASGSDQMGYDPRNDGSLGGSSPGPGSDGREEIQEYNPARNPRAPIGQRIAMALQGSPVGDDPRQDRGIFESGYPMEDVEGAGDEPAPFTRPYGPSSTDNLHLADNSRYSKVAGDSRPEAISGLRQKVMEILAKRGVGNEVPPDRPSLMQPAQETMPEQDPYDKLAPDDQDTYSQMQPGTREEFARALAGGKPTQEGPPRRPVGGGAMDIDGADLNEDDLKRMWDANPTDNTGEMIDAIAKERGIRPPWHPDFQKSNSASAR